MSKSIYDFTEKDRVLSTINQQNEIFREEDEKQESNWVKYAILALGSLAALLIVKRIML